MMGIDAFERKDMLGHERMSKQLNLAEESYCNMTISRLKLQNLNNEPF